MLNMVTRSPVRLHPFHPDWELLPVNSSQESLQFLIYLIDQIRPQRGKPDAAANLRELILYLQNSTSLQTKLQLAVVKTFERVHFSTFFTHSGMPVGRNFWPELSRRLRHKILPPLSSEFNFDTLLNKLFRKAKDYQWVEAIGPQLWTEFFNSTGWHFSMQDLKKIYPAIEEAALNLSFQLANLGLENDIQRFLNLHHHRRNPFILQNYLLQQFYRQSELHFEEMDSLPSTASIHNALNACAHLVNEITNNHPLHGTSLSQNYFLLLIRIIIQRLYLLLDLSDGDKHFDTAEFSQLWIKAVTNEKRKNSIREFISQSVGYVAYQIAEVKGVKGKKLITTTGSSYAKMWWSAMAGGFIISFIALFKNMLSTLHLAPMWQGFGYSMNYALGFVAIEDTGSTLATKQPAFTASALAKSLDHKNRDHPHLTSMVKLIIDIVRSQFASFGGNLLVVFPGTFLLAWLYHLATGHYLLSGDNALSTLKAQHPVQSLALLYASFTGVFLFLSSILAGYVHNKIRYGHWHERICQAFMIHSFFPSNWTDKFRQYILNNGGTFAGNVALGFFLGMAGTLGYIFGLPFDIRHITIACGNVAIALYGLPVGQLEPGFLISVFLGVLLIGFFNFLVSFALAFYVAIKSRGLSLDRLPLVLALLWRAFWTAPTSFFWPVAPKPLRSRSAEEP